MSYGLLFDQTLCVGCGACELACQSEHEQPPHKAVKLDDQSFTYVEKVNNNLYQRHLCMHCENPTCGSVCPVAALKKTKEGAVTYDASICLGCRYCVMACPFHVPKYEWHSPFPRVRKCDLCYDRRSSKGIETACASVCPTGATVFGERAKLLDIARDRVKKEPKKYQAAVYGEKEAGGTSVMMLLQNPVNQSNLYENVPVNSLPLLTWQVLEKLPVVIPVWGVFLGGMYYLTKRKNEIANEKEGGKDAE
jgi:formate dehydrogenase iron-sulfur subunit